MLETTVLLNESQLPSPEDLQNFIDNSNVSLEMNLDFSWGDHVGWLPCRYRGEEAGFELYSESFTPEKLVDEEFLTSEESKLVGDRSYMITFVTHFSVTDSICAFLVSTCLAKMADGFVLENAEPPFLKGDELYVNLKESEKEMLSL